MATFALVHGAWHGAWSWERLSPELEVAGHSVVAVDLPCDDPQSTFSDYADMVVASLEDADDDVVVVGHSLAGQTIPMVAARRPVQRLVYLCALIALPGRSFFEQLGGADPVIMLPNYEAGLGELDKEGRRRWVDFGVAWSEMYGDCDEETARAAFDRLRPQATAPYRVPCPLGAMPAVETVYVAGSEDRIVNPDWSRRAAPERLGVEPVELAGSHSPMIARAREVAELLQRGL
jgi:pimeloyl-ACP methyl ester carboxylesterase